MDMKTKVSQLFQQKNNKNETMCFSSKNQLKIGIDHLVLGFNTHLDQWPMTSVTVWTVSFYQTILLMNLWAGQRKIPHCYHMQESQSN